MHSHRRILILVVVGVLTLLGDRARGAELLVGAATADITPGPGVLTIL